MSESLFRAIRTGDADEVKRLIDAGCDPNCTMPAESDHGSFLDQVTPLMVAAAAPYSTVEIVAHLLAAAADPFAVSAGEVTATWYAAGGGTGYPLTDANRKTLDGNHPYLNWGGGDVDRLKLLLEAGGDPNESASNGRSCVYEACSVGDPQRLELLLQSGAKPGPACAPTDESDSLAGIVENKLWASVRGYLPVTPYQLVPLFAAASSGSVACTKLIVEAGFHADYNLADDDALSHAGSVEVVEYLWELGLRPSGGSFGFDAIDNAIEDNNLPVLDFLLRRVDSAALQQKLLTASGVRMNPEAVKLILDLGANPNELSQDYGSPLHTACWQGDGNGGREDSVVEKTIRTLLEGGADPNLVARGGRPLHEAVSGDWSSPTSTRILLEFGAEVDARNDAGQTALMLAAEGGGLECIRALLGAGADRKLKDRRGKTPLDLARSHLKLWQKPKFKLIDSFMEQVLSLTGESNTAWKERARENAEAVVELLAQ